MNTNEMETILRAVDHASGASDRWAFFVALAVLGSVTAIAVKWLVSRIELQMAAMAKDREAYEASLKSIIADQHAQMKLSTESQVRNTVALDLNTAALNHVTRVVNANKESRA